MRLTVLGSGSRGNAMLVESDDTRVLLDVGFGPRALAQRLARVHVAAEAIGALVLTHEHDDHAKGAAAACAKWGWPVYAPASSLRAIGDVMTPARAVAPGTTFAIGDLHWTAFTVPHDASACVAYRIESKARGLRLAVVLDLGHAPETLAETLGPVDALVVEANHDVALLEQGPYPWVLKRRIASDRGHLSNVQAAEFAGACAHRGLRSVVLAHLSEQNNTPAHALDAVGSALRRRGHAALARTGVTAASQRRVLGPLGVGSTRARSEGQFELL